jgi:hypothetical protein
MKLIVVLVAALGIAGALAAMQMPEIKRYLKMRSM